MKKYDIYPTEDKLKESIDKDTTGRNKNIFYLLKLLNLQDGGWAIAIDGAWGTGKTFFVKQCQYILERLNSDNYGTTELLSKLNFSKNEDISLLNKKSFRTLYYDAWEHDQDSDPIESILACVAQSNWKAEIKQNVEKAIDIGISILSVTTPLGSSINEIKDKLLNSKNVDNLEKLKKEFNKVLSKLAPENGQLIIFVDELDRCKPTYAVKVLERIKHYFNNPNVTFIFSIDLGQLQNTIKRYYGNQFNGYLYLDRFFDLVIKLPGPNLTKYLDNTENILEIDTLFDGRKNNYYHKFCIELINHFSLSLRQINHFYLKTNSTTYNLINSSLNCSFPYDGYGSFIIYTFVLPLMCGLSLYNLEEYNKFIKGKASDNILKVLANSPSFSKYYKSLLSEKQRENIKMLEEVKKLYNAVFNNNRQNNEVFIISESAKLEWPANYKNRLIDACSLLTPDAKF